MDAYPAAFAISPEFQMVTLDRDFTAFDNHGLELQLLNPAA